MIRTHGLETHEVIGSVVDNGWLVRNKSLLEAYMRDDMLANNMLPALDIPIAITVSYDQKIEAFTFRLIGMGYMVDSTEGYVGAISNDSVALTVDMQKVTLIEET